MILNLNRGWNYLWLPVLADRSTFELAVTADNKIGDNFIFVSCEIRLSDRLIFFLLLTSEMERMIMPQAEVQPLNDPFHVPSPNTVFIK